MAFKGGRPRPKANYVPSSAQDPSPCHRTEQASPRSLLLGGLRVWVPGRPPTPSPRSSFQALPRCDPARPAPPSLRASLSPWPLIGWGHLPPEPVPD